MHSLRLRRVHATAATNSNSAVQQPSPFQNDAKALFTPVQLGELPRLEHRIVMAPLTRNRCGGKTGLAFGVAWSGRVPATGRMSMLATNKQTPPQHLFHTYTGPSRRCQCQRCRLTTPSARHQAASSSQRALPSARKARGECVWLSKAWCCRGTPAACGCQHVCAAVCVCIELAGVLCVNVRVCLCLPACLLACQPTMHRYPDVPGIHSEEQVRLA